MSNFMKICSAGPELFYAEDGQTDRQKDGHDEINSHFSQFLKRA